MGLKMLHPDIDGQCCVHPFAEANIKHRGARERWGGGGVLFGGHGAGEEARLTEQGKADANL